MNWPSANARFSGDWVKNGHSFQSLLSDTRHALACEYLAQAALDIAEIAYMLGYDDHGSFYRAFQKWEAKTPSQWREDQTATAHRVRER